MQNRLAPSPKALSSRVVLAVAAAAFTSFAAADAHATVYEIGPADDLVGAIAALVPGDELVLAGGSYVLSGYFEIAVAGTAGQPIVIRAKDGETPVIEQQAVQNIVNILGSYVTLRGLELKGGDRGIRIQGASYVTIEDCHVHDTAANAIAANDVGVDYAGIILRHNHIHDTGGNGEGMYLGCNNNGCQFHDALIERNWIHDTKGPTVDQGDGIEIKEGSWGNVVRDNVIHDTGYPCIITYSAAGNGPANVIERNAMWGCGDHGIQSAADVIIRNNIVLGAAADGIRSQPHQSGAPANVEIVHNTVLMAANNAIRVDGAVGSVLVANNAVYAQAGSAIQVGGDLTGVTVAGNVGFGALAGASTGLSATGSLSDFVLASYSGAPPNDVFPAPGSMLIGVAAPAHLVMDDFNGTARAGQADVGAYRFDPAGNPGWQLVPGFKDAPTMPPPVNASGGGDTGGGGTSGAAASGGASSAGGAGVGGAGAGSGDDGCDCATAHGGDTNRSALLLALGLSLALRRRSGQIAGATVRAADARSCDRGVGGDRGGHRP